MCMRGYRVLCATAARTRDAFHRERAWRKPQGQFRAFDRIDVLLIDQLGYIPFERKATDPGPSAHSGTPATCANGRLRVWL